MTLHVYEQLEQGSPEWHDQRRGIVTASVVGQLITPKTIKPANNDTTRGLHAIIAAERITGWTDENYVSSDMERGHFDEPLAIEAYRQHHAPVTTCGLMVRDNWGFKIGYSPDATVSHDGLVEAKSRRPKKHVATVNSGQVPPENMAQIQTGLLVSDRDWCDYVSFCGGMELWVKRVYPDPAWFDAIVAAVTAFEEAVEQIVTTYRAAVAGLPMTERTIREVVI